MSHERPGATDEWFTPKYLFDEMGVTFDLDVASPVGLKTFVPAKRFLVRDSLSTTWSGFVWMNPPFGGRNGIAPWLDKFFDHGNGVCLTPDRTGCPWFQAAAKRADALFFCTPKIRFIRPDGTQGASPPTGTCLFSAGPMGMLALENLPPSRGVLLVRP